MTETMTRIEAIVKDRTNEQAVIQVALDLGYTFPRSGREDWDDRENFDTWLTNLISLYEQAERPRMKGESAHAKIVNKGIRDARIFLDHAHPQVNTSEKLLQLLLERGAIES